MISQETKLSVFGRYHAADPDKATQLDPDEKQTLRSSEVEAKQNAMATIAILPLIMAACYLGLLAYFRRKGGYKAMGLTAEGQVAGEHPVTGQEAFNDEAQMPNR